MKSMNNRFYSLGDISIMSRGLWMLVIWFQFLSLSAQQKIRPRDFLGSFWTLFLIWVSGSLNPMKFLIYLSQNTGKEYWCLWWGKWLVKLPHRVMLGTHSFESTLFHWVKFIGNHEIWWAPHNIYWICSFE